MSEEYDPLVSLKQEVKRFCDTNQFNPLYVTHFYAQARCVITDYERTIADNARLLSTLEACRAELAEFKSALPGLNAPFIFEAGVARSRAEAAEAALAEANERHAKSDKCREENWQEVLRLRAENARLATLNGQEVVRLTERVKEVWLEAAAGVRRFVVDDGEQMKLREAIAFWLQRQAARPLNPDQGEMR